MRFLAVRKFNFAISAEHKCELVPLRELRAHCSDESEIELNFFSLFVCRDLNRICSNAKRFRSTGDELNWISFVASKTQVDWTRTTMSAQRTTLSLCSNARAQKYSNEFTEDLMSSGLTMPMTVSLSRTRNNFSDEVKRQSHRVFHFVEEIRKKNVVDVRRHWIYSAMMIMMRSVTVHQRHTNFIWFIGDDIVVDAIEIGSMHSRVSRR